MQTTKEQKEITEIFNNIFDIDKKIKGYETIINS